MSEDIRSYNLPPETPREEMWEGIVGRIRAEAVPVVDIGVKLDAARGARGRRSVARGWAAAAAVLAIGIALGRATAPGPTPREPTQTAAASGSADGALGPVEEVRPTTAALDLAARRHLGRSESLLTMVRTDAREGRIDPEVAPWARNLLMQTRLLLDARIDADPNLDGLLAELELVLTQIVGVSEMGTDEGRMRTELDLTIEGMEGREVLSRIRAAMPSGMTSE